MKNTHFIIPLLAFLLAFGSLNAQVSKGWQYQAVMRDGNQIKANTALQARFTLLKDNSTGSIAYIETHSDTTNEFGLVSLPLGHGQPSLGNFGTIDLAGGAVFFEGGNRLGEWVSGLWDRGGVFSAAGG